MFLLALAPEPYRYGAETTATGLFHPPVSDRRRLLRLGNLSVCFRSRQSPARRDARGTGEARRRRLICAFSKFKNTKLGGYLRACQSSPIGRATHHLSATLLHYGKNKKKPKSGVLSWSPGSVEVRVRLSSARGSYLCAIAACVAAFSGLWLRKSSAGNTNGAFLTTAEQQDALWSL